MYYSFIKLNKCVPKLKYNNFEHLIMGNKQNLFIYKIKMTWMEAYKFSIMTNLNMLVLKKYEDQIEIIKFLQKNMFNEPFWVDFHSLNNKYKYLKRLEENS